jgi:TonB-dependent receptor
VFLPALSFNWFYTSDAQLRFSASRTVSRPDFKETSNAVFYDTEFDYRVRGNPFLEVSSATNLDLRWENYWSNTESVSVAGFFKDLESPIERVVQPASGTAGNSRTFQNAESGQIYGIEVDGRREFGINDAFTRSVFVALNASLIESEVSLATGETRALQGQPEYTANLILGYDDLPTRQEVTLLFNQNGESIQDVGVSGLPDVIEEPRLSVDLNYRYEHSDTVTFRVKTKNLLDSDVEFTQGGQTFQQYNRGVELEAGVDWTF